MGRAAQVVIAFATLRIATTMLSPAEFGLFALLTGFRAFFGLFLISPVGQHVNRHTHEWFDQHTLRSYLKAYQGYILAVSVIATISLVIWSWLHGTIFKEPIVWTSVMMGLVVLSGTWNATLVPMLNMLGQRLQAVCLEFITSLCTLMSAVILCKIHDTGSMWFAGSIIGCVIGSGLAWIALGQILGPQLQPTQPFMNKQILRHYCAPLAVSAALLWFYTTSYRFVIEWFWGAEILGTFAFAYIFASQIWAVFEALMTQFIYPYFYRTLSVSASDMPAKAFCHLVNAVLPIYLFLLALFIMGADLVLPLVSGHQAYQAMSWLLPFAFIFEFFRVISALLSQATQVTKNTSDNITPYVVGGGLVLASSLISAIMDWPVIYLALLLVASGALLFAAMFKSMFNHIAFHIDLYLIALPLCMVIINLVLKPLLRPSIGYATMVLCLEGMLFMIYCSYLFRNNHHVHALLKTRI
nr:oligosaccharide flippase family protein [Methylophilus sp. QUAN]